ncbi:MAG TPA: M48 family metalloprotease [Gelria sp.]|jgi:heat shock protein HtpX|nr:M48 family metalloprotease [Gelria sp.]
MAYILFTINFCISWCVLFAVLMIPLAHFQVSWTMGATITTIVSVVSIIFFSTSGAKFLRAHFPHRPLSKQEAAFLNPILEEVFERAKLKKRPKVFMQDELSPNASVVGDAIIITTGLLRIANRNEVAAVIAHECGHIANKDLTFVTANYAASRIGDITLTAGLVILTIVSLNGRIPLIYLPFFMIACVLKAIQWILSGIVRLASRIYCRNREYGADSFAASIGYREATISYFEKINEMYPEKRNSIFSTHPTMTRRIEALSN